MLQYTKRRLHRHKDARTAATWLGPPTRVTTTAVARIRRQAAPVRGRDTSASLPRPAARPLRHPGSEPPPPPRRPRPSRPAQPARQAPAPGICDNLLRRAARARFERELSAEASATSSTTCGSMRAAARHPSRPPGLRRSVPCSLLVRCCGLPANQGSFRAGLRAKSDTPNAARLFVGTSSLGRLRSPDRDIDPVPAAHPRPAERCPRQSATPIRRQHRAHPPPLALGLK